LGLSTEKVLSFQTEVDQVVGTQLPRLHGFSMQMQDIQIHSLQCALTWSQTCKDLVDEQGVKYFITSLGRNVHVQ